jgi:hypothetical protein
MLVCLQKLIIQQDLPLLMEEFSMTMCRTLAADAFPPCKIFERVWELVKRR